MKSFWLPATLAVLVCRVTVLSAQPPVPAAPLPSLDSVRWVGPAASLETLRGKTVVALVYATWCPKCNVWSGDLFRQLKEAIRDKPVVVLAINADKTPTGVSQYLATRGFFAPNVLHGYDPTMPGRLGFQSNLYNYVLIGPDGALLKKGSAGSFYNLPEGKKFALPADLARSDNLGRFNVLTEEMSQEVKELLWPMELGNVSEALLNKARNKLSTEQKKELNAAVFRFLDGQLQQIRDLSEGEVPDRLRAYEKASVLATMFRATKQSKEAKKLVAELSRDKQFKRELGAKKFYERSLNLAAANPARRTTLLRSVARRFDGTYYGRQAKEQIGE